MNKLSKMISELCPNGCEYKELGKIVNIFIGSFVKKTEQDRNYSYPVYNGGIEPTGYYHKINSKKNSVVISARGANCGFVNYVTIDFWAGNSCYVMKKLPNYIESKFLFYFLKTNEKVIYNLRQTSGIPAVNSNQLSSIEIPIPPLPVQQEIVRVLDQYSAVEEELEAKLQAELDACNQQYEYYREFALSDTESVWEYERIGDVCSRTDNIVWNEVGDSTFKYVDLSSVDRETHSIGATKIINSNSAPSRAQQVVIADDVIFGTTRPTLKRYCLIPDKYDGQICSTGFCVLRADKVKVLPKFLFHQISKREFYSYLERVQRGVAYPSVSDTDVKRFKIPIPPLAEQERIVSILDRLDRQVNELKQALQSELEARRKQYEYYRDKLLTFKELQA